MSIATRTLAAPPLILVSALLGGCDTMPTGPTVTVFQADGKSLDEFQADDADCRRFAEAQLGGATSVIPIDEAAAINATRGTAVCSTPGVAVDRRSVETYSAQRTGSVIDGIEAAQFAGQGSQRRYNCAYVQCMYMLKGEKIPRLSGERWPPPRGPWPPDPDAYYPRLSR
jgi:hypothetical protein